MATAIATKKKQDKALAIVVATDRFKAWLERLYRTVPKYPNFPAQAHVLFELSNGTLTGYATNTDGGGCRSVIDAEVHFSGRLLPHAALLLRYLKASPKDGVLSIYIEGISMRVDDGVSSILIPLFDHSDFQTTLFDMPLDDAVHLPLPFDFVADMARALPFASTDEAGKQAFCSVVIYASDTEMGVMSSEGRVLVWRSKMEQFEDEPLPYLYKIIPARSASAVVSLFSDEVEILVFPKFVLFRNERDALYCRILDFPALQFRALTEKKPDGFSVMVEREAMRAVMARFVEMAAFYSHEVFMRVEKDGRIRMKSLSDEMGEICIDMEAKRLDDGDTVDLCVFAPQIKDVMSVARTEAVWFRGSERATLFMPPQRYGDDKNEDTAIAYIMAIVSNKSPGWDKESKDSEGK